MGSLPEIAIGFVIGVFGWLLKDKINGVKEIDQKLSLKLDDLTKMVYELTASVKGIEDMSRRVARLEDQVTRLIEHEKR
jgi:uncharacterized protein YoxC